MTEEELRRMLENPTECIQFVIDSLGERDDGNCPRHAEIAIMTAGLLEVIGRIGNNERVPNFVYCLLSVVYDMGLQDGGKDDIPSAFKEG